MMKKTKHLTIIAATLILLLISFQVNATEYFVAEGGSGNGTKASPFGTLAEAMAVAVAHDIITLRAGTYDGLGDDYITIPYLTIQGYDGERPHISSPYSSSAPAMTIWIGALAHDITLRNLEISGGKNYTLKFDSYWDWPAGGDERARNALIEDCEIHHSGNDIIKITPECDNMTIRNCEVHHAGLANLSGDIVEAYPNCQGIDNVNSDNMLITQCHVHDIPYDNPAIFFKGGAMDCIIERNLLENAYGGVWIGAQTDYGFFSTDVNPDYFNAINGVVRNNIIKNMRGSGIVFLSAKDSKVYNNTLIDCGNGEGDMIALGFRHQVTWNGSIPTNAPTVNAYVVNNVIVKNPSNTNVYKDFIIEFSGYNDENGQIHAIEEGSLQMDYNRYYDNNNSNLRVRDNNNIVDYVDHTTLSEWQSSILHNSSFAESNSLFGDPKIDSDGNPLVGSNCIGAGIDIDGLTEDYYGNSRPAGSVNIGAVQIAFAPSNQKPSVSITSPSSGATYTESADITINANASDSDGSITKVEFYNGSTKLGEDNSSPYSYSWTGVSAGTYSLSAKATDNDGATKTSSSVSITVNEPSGGGSNEYRYLRLKILANLGSTQVEFYNIDFFEGSTQYNLDYFWGNANDLPFNIDKDLGAGNSANPTSIRFQNGYDKTHQAESFECYGSNDNSNWTLIHEESGLTVDDWGATDTYTTFSISGASNNAPSVSITSPSNGATFTESANITIETDASDSDGSIAKVEFYNGSTLLGEDTSSPYTYSWTGVSAGTYSLTAKARDDDGATTTSNSVSVTVNEPSSSGTEYRYLRLKILANLGATQVEFYNIDFFEGSTQYNLDYFWGNANNLPFNIDKDLGAGNSASPTSIRFQNGYNKTHQAESFECYGSNDNSNWTLIHSESELTVDDWGAENTYTSFTISSAGNDAPTVNITSPSDGATFVSAADISIQADAADADGSIAKVEFYNGSTLLGEDSSSPYSFTWAGVSAGSYTITAKATDNNGAETTSNAINITVNEPVNVNYRYLRLKILSNLGSTQVEFYNIDFFEDATSYNLDYFWGNANNLPFNIDKDLGEGNSASPTSIRFQNGYNRTHQAESFECYGSNDNSSWTLIYSKSGLSIDDWGATDTYTTFNFDGTKSTQSPLANSKIKASPDNVSIFPNPGVGLFNFSFSSEYIGEVSIKIYTHDGRQIEHQILQKHSALLSHEFDFEHYPSGLYIFKVVAGNNLLQQKIIIK